jgi:hypothetical protein
MGLFGRGRGGDEARERPATETGTGRPTPRVRNERVREALASWSERKDAQTFADVVRRLPVGELLLDVTDSRIADPAAGPQPGDTLAIGSHVDNAGKQLLVAFTDQDELNRYRGRPGTSLVQPAAAVLAQAARDYEGIVVDGRSPGAFIAYADELRQQLADDPETAGALAQAVVERSQPFPAFVASLAAARVFVPFTTRRDGSGAEPLTVPGVVGPAGARYAVLGTAPAELWAWSPGCGAQPTGLANVARAVLQDGQAGVVVNPAGPSVTVPADALRPFTER